MLAADVAADLISEDIGQVQQCEYAEVVLEADTIEGGESTDFESTAIPEDSSGGVEVESGLTPTESVADSEEDVDRETTGDVQADPDASDSVEDQVHDLGDPVDGTDGFFGSIKAESPSQAFGFTTSEAGMVNVVVASSFGGAETRLEVVDASGEMIASTTTEDLSGFQVLSFESEAGESYQLTVASEDGAEGYFQVTVEHNEVSEPVDLHEDEIGEDSTELELIDGVAALGGDLEKAGDIDTFRFTPDANGKISLGLAELNPDNATELQVEVFNGNGELLTRGITNEIVGISFDVQCDVEYFIAVSAGEGQTGQYQIDMTLDAEAVEPETDPVADPDTDLDADLDADTETESDTETDAGAEEDSEPDLEIDADPVAESESDTDTVVDPESDAETDEDFSDPVGSELETDDSEESDSETDITEDDTDVEADAEVDDDGSESTELEFVDGVASVSGDLGGSDPGDTFEFVASTDGSVDLDLTTESEGNAIDVSLSVLGIDGELVVDGTTNDDVGIVFDITEGDTYQVSVDSINDVPASYELTATLTPASLTETDDDQEQLEDADPGVDVADDLVSSDATLDDGSDDVADDQADDEMEVCFSDLNMENGVLDSLFAELGADSVFGLDFEFEIRRS